MSFNEIYNELFGIRVVLQDVHTDEAYIIKQLKIHLRDNTTISHDNIDKTIIDFYKYYGINFTEEFVSSIQIMPSLHAPNIASLLLGGELQNIMEEDEEDSDDELLNEVDNSEENEEEDSTQQVDQSNNVLNNVNIFQQYNTINFQNMNINTPEQFFSLINSRVESLGNQGHLNQFVSAINSIATIPIPSPNQNMEDVKVTLEKEDLDKITEEILEKDLDTKCSICMMDYKKGNTVSKLKCGHFFHKDCITQWLDEYNYKCPVCRTECGKAKYHI